MNLLQATAAAALALTACGPGTPGSLDDADDAAPLATLTQSVSLATTPSPSPGFYDPNFGTAKPMDEIQGRVQAILELNGVVYAAGKFPSVIDANGTDLKGACSHLCAFNASTGALLRTFAPLPDGEVIDLVASKDGSRVFAVGNFGRFASNARARVAAFTALSGPTDSRTAAQLLLASPNVALDGAVKALVFGPREGRAYIGGAFSHAGGSARGELARFNIDSAGSWTLDSTWTPPSVSGGDVQALLLKPDGSELVVGGKFTAPAPTSLALSTAAGAARMPWGYSVSIKDRGDGLTYKLLTNAAGDQVYVGGGAAGGNSVVSVNWAGTGSRGFSSYKVNWFYTTDGNVQALALGRLGTTEVLFAGHHGNYIASAVNTTDATKPGQKQEHFGFLAVRASDGALQSFGHPPDFYAPKTCAGVSTSSPLKVWALFQSQVSGNLYAGGDFTSLKNSCASANSTRRLAKFAATLR